MIANSKVQLNTTGWTRNPGLVGPYLDMTKGEPAADAYPKLPEMHTGVTGERQPGNGINLLQTERFPMARNWSQLEELARYPMNLPPVNPTEFRYVRSPEMLFTDRFGVTMQGVAQTPQCGAIAEHEICNRSIADTVGYDRTLASHGITYEDYRRFIVETINILSRNTASTDWLAKSKALKRYFYAATENLRARGVPVVVKFKMVVHSTVLWRQSTLSIRHHPLHLPVRGKLGKEINVA